MLPHKLYQVLILVLISLRFDIANAKVITGYQNLFYDNLTCPKDRHFSVEEKHDIAVVSRICEDCHDLYRDPSIYTRCREDCFQNEIFEGCAQALQKNEEEMKELDKVVKKLNHKQ